MKDPFFTKGLKLRREILGDAYVDAGMKNVDRYNLPMQQLATSVGWGHVWSRPGIPRKWRSVLNLGMLVAQGHEAELELHIHTALGNGLTRDEVAECLLQTAVYCGFPAALGAFRTMRKVYAELDAAVPAKKAAKTAVRKGRTKVARRK
jgi:4-carboxymuconolactone decarboxylase